MVIYLQKSVNLTVGKGTPLPGCMRRIGKAGESPALYRNGDIRKN